MHKKIVALFALVALVCGAMFADVAVKAEYGLTLSQQKNLMRLFISSFWMEPGLQTPTPLIQSMTGTVERMVWFL